MARKSFTSPSELPDNVKIQCGSVVPMEIVEAYEQANNTAFKLKEIVSKEKVLKDPQ